MGISISPFFTGQLGLGITSKTTEGIRLGFVLGRGIWQMELCLPLLCLALETVPQDSCTQLLLLGEMRYERKAYIPGLELGSLSPPESSLPLDSHNDNN